MNLIEATKLEAMQLGEKNASLKLATNFLQKGIDLMTVSTCTGLSVKELKDLEKETQIHRQNSQHA